MDAKDDPSSIGGVHGEDRVLADFDGLDPHPLESPVGYGIERKLVETGALFGGRELGERFTL